MAQAVKLLTFDFHSGRDLQVMRSSPALGSKLNVEPTWDSVPPSLPHSLFFSFSLTSLLFFYTYAFSLSVS